MKPAIHPPNEGIELFFEFPPLKVWAIVILCVPALSVMLGGIFVWIDLRPEFVRALHGMERSSWWLVVLVAPLLEEFGCRWLVQGLLFQQVIFRKFANPWWSIVPAAALFGGLHFFWEHLLFAFLYGLVLGWLMWRTGSIWIPLFVHVLNNAIGWWTIQTWGVEQVYLTPPSDWMPLWLYALIWATSLLIVVWAVRALLRYYG